MEKLILYDEDLVKIVGAGIVKNGNYWEVYDDITRETIGKYSEYKYAEWADQYYKEEGKISYFGFVC